MRLSRLLLSVAALFWASSAAANAPAPYSRPLGAVPGAVTLRASPVVVLHERLVIDCAHEGGWIHPNCNLDATYDLFNPTAQEEELVGAFYKLRGNDRRSQSQESSLVRATVDGEDAHAEITGEQADTLDDVVSEDPEAKLFVTRDGFTYERAPFRVVVGAGQRVKLRFEGTFEPVAMQDDSMRGDYSYPAIELRHPAVMSGDRYFTKATDDFVYLITPLGKWAGNPSIDVTLVHFADSDLTVQSPVTSPKRSAMSNVVTERFTMTTHDNLRFRFHHEPWPINSGGPVFGIGPRIGREELRLKFGWDFGVSTFAILGAAVETNFDYYLTAVASLEAATPGIFFIIPSLSAGLRVPVQFRENAPTRVGGGVKLGIHLPLLGFSFPIDYYPVASSSRSHVEGAFLTELSF